MARFDPATAFKQLKAESQREKEYAESEKELAYLAVIFLPLR
jgi:hypothetical protein